MCGVSAYAEQRRCQGVLLAATGTERALFAPMLDRRALISLPHLRCLLHAAVAASAVLMEMSKHAG